MDMKKTKKTKSYVRNYSQRVNGRPLGREGLILRSKPYQNIKRQDNKRKIRIKDTRDVFDSLDSFFNVTKPLNLTDIESYIEHFVQPRQSVTSITQITLQMASRENMVEEVESDGESQVSSPRDEDTSQLSSPGSEKARKENYKSDSDSEETLQDHKTTDGEDDKKSVDSESVSEHLKHNSEETIPENLSRRSSMSSAEEEEDIQDKLSVNAMTDTELTKKMRVAQEKCVAIKEEIAQLQAELEEIQQNEELEEDYYAELLEQKNRDVTVKMIELEQVTKQIQTLLDLNTPASDISDTEVEDDKTSSSTSSHEETSSPKPSEIWKEAHRTNPFNYHQQAYPEDKLPKVIVCDSTEEKFPKIVIASDEEKLDVQDEKASLKNYQNDFELKQETIATMNELGKLLPETKEPESSLEQTIRDIQTDLRSVVKDNSELSRKLDTLNQQLLIICSEKQGPQTNITDPSRLSGGGSRTFQHSPLEKNPIMSYPKTIKMTVADSSQIHGICPAEITDKLTHYEANTNHLGQRLGNIESTVINMKMELANVQKDREQLIQRSQLLKCTAPCAPCVCMPSPQVPDTPTARFQAMPPSPSAPYTSQEFNASDQLRDLKEQYARLQEDYKNKLTEVSCLRTDFDKIKQEIREAKDARDKAENKLLDVEERLRLSGNERRTFGGNKEQLMEQEQSLIVAKQRFQVTQEELEDAQLLIQDQANQLDDYRNKYLQAQEQVEELKRVIDLMEKDNARINENVTLEVNRMKSRFQEKLDEFTPLPEILKQTQIKLQECQQMRLAAERNCEELSRELLNYKDGAISIQSKNLKSENFASKGDKNGSLDILGDINHDLKSENERLKNTVKRLEDRDAEHQKRLEDKMHEIAQLASTLDQVREDSARQVARTKERCEKVRRSMQEQISQMEKELAQCRATARAAQKDQDEIRQKMQSQINYLNESFNQAQGRMKSLQGHVNYLKSTYSNIFTAEGAENHLRVAAETLINHF